MSQIALIKASNPQAYANFGNSVAIEDDTIVIGAPYEDISGAPNGGAVYIFNRNAGGFNNWGQVKKLSKAGPETGDLFGNSVAISGDIVVVGAPNEDHYGINSAGAIYIYGRNQGGIDNWGLIKREIRTIYKTDDHFGYSVAIDDNIVVAGTSGIRNTSETACVAYIYELNRGGENQWGLVKKIKPSYEKSNDGFGISVTVENDTIAVGADNADSGGIQGAGAVFVFGKDKGGTDNWGEIKHISLGLFFAHPGDQFGRSVSLKSGMLVVGVPNEDSKGTAYVYYRDRGGENNWGKVKRLALSDGHSGDNFGFSLCITENTVLIGAPNVDTPGTIDSVGAAYLYLRHYGGTDNWQQSDVIYPETRETNAHFGQSVAMSGKTLLAGEPYRDTTIAETGAAYIFEPKFPWILFYPAFVHPK